MYSPIFYPPNISRVQYVTPKLFYPVCAPVPAMRHVEEDGVHKDAANRLVASLVNIRAIVNHFTPKIDSWSASHQVASLTPDQVGDCTIRVRWDQELIMCRGEYLTLYSPVINDCTEVKRLPFRVT